jgi:hypothetical protein
MADDDQQRILITQATPGMVLAQSVFTQNRVPLCGPGTELTDSLIHRLTMRGVKRIHVRGLPLPDRVHRPFEEQRLETQERFSRGQQPPMMHAIHDTIIDQIARIT